ncbi:MAG: Crp/Fnr family transcriptional regulator [Crocinitomicaceae bacterium]
MTIEEIIQKTEGIFASLPPECQLEFMNNSTVRNLEKGEVVVREGQYSKKAYFILQGCSRSYYMKDGKDVSDWFAFEGEFVSPIVSFFSDKPNPHYIEFLEDSLAIEFTKDTIDMLSKKYRNFEQIITSTVTETMLNLCERLYYTQFTKAEERYEHLLSIHPDITNRISLTHIASYLGITLETLSRIRSAKSRI